MKEILAFIHYTEKLKDTLRHNWTSKDRHESVSEHSWRMSLMALTLSKKLDNKNKVNLEKVLKMITIHDLAEIETGDIPAFNKTKKDEQKEHSAIKAIEKFPDTKEILALWNEFEEMKTNESKFVKALDKIEVRIQHNESSIERWNEIEFPRSQFAADKFCIYDSFLKKFNEEVKEESKQKIIASGKNFQEVLKQVEEMKPKSQ